MKKIEIFLGKVRPAKAKEFHPEWFIRIHSSNGEQTWRSAEGYKKLQSALNMIESTLVEGACLSTPDITILHKDGSPEQVHFVHNSRQFHVIGKPTGAGAVMFHTMDGKRLSGVRSAYHYRKDFGMLVRLGKKKRK
jgi:uncharacterized protein YegP (UPF0339 family)